MAMAVLTWLHLLTLEQVAGRDVEPAGNRLHQLIAGDREAIHVAAAGCRIPGMCQRGDGGNQRHNNKQSRSHQYFSLSVAGDPWQKSCQCKKSMFCLNTYDCDGFCALRTAHCSNAQHRLPSAQTVLTTTSRFPGG